MDLTYRILFVFRLAPNLETKVDFDVEFSFPEKRLSDQAKKDAAVNHALAVRAAVTSENYVKFFRLYKAAPNLNACLMGGSLIYESCLIEKCYAGKWQLI